jgi:hypothetical protein
VYDDVYDAVGDDFTEDEVVEAIRECNYDTKKSVSYLLYGTYPDSQHPKKTNSSKSTATKLNQSAKQTSIAQPKSEKLTKESTTSKQATTQAKLGLDEAPSQVGASGQAGVSLKGNNTSLSALAVDLCAPVVVTPPQLKAAVVPGSSSGVHLYYQLLYISLLSISRHSRIFFLRAFS